MTEVRRETSVEKTFLDRLDARHSTAICVKQESCLLFLPCSSHLFGAWKSQPIPIGWRSETRHQDRGHLFTPAEATELWVRVTQHRSRRQLMLSEKADAVEPRPQIKHLIGEGRSRQGGEGRRYSHRPPLTFTAPNTPELRRVFVSSILTEETALVMGCF